MNTTNCPAGFATDETFRIGTSAPCGVTLLGFDIGMAVLLTLRLLTAVLVWRDWMHKKEDVCSPP